MAVSRARISSRARSTSSRSEVGTQPRHGLLQLGDPRVGTVQPPGQLRGRLAGNDDDRGRDGADEADPCEHFCLHVVPVDTEQPPRRTGQT